MRHVSRTQRVYLDWLFDRINLEKAIHVIYVNTAQQIADVLTWGSLSQERWMQLTHLRGFMTHQTHSCSPHVVFSSCLDGNMWKRASEMPDEQISAKSKLIRGLCLSEKKRWITSDEKGQTRKLHAERILKVENRQDTASNEIWGYNESGSQSSQWRQRNRHCIITMRWWHRIWLLDGRRVIRAETRLRKKRWEMCSDFYIKKASLEPLTLIVHWSSQKNAKPYRGIVKSLNHTDPTQMESPKEQPEELKKGLRLFLVRSRLDEQRWGEVMECYLASRKSSFMKRWKGKKLLSKGDTTPRSVCHGTFWIRDILSSSFH